MEVILREHVDNLGRRGEVVKVANGYARNFLLPRKLALAVTEENKRQIERERAKAEARDAEEKSQAEAFGAAPSQTDVEIARRVGENNTLYGSVTSADIAQALVAKGFEIDKRKIQLPSRSRRSARSRCRQGPSRRDGAGQGDRRRREALSASTSAVRRLGDRLSVTRSIASALRSAILQPIAPMPDVAADRTLPHNLEAEKSVLGAILINNDAFNQAAEVIDARDFFRDAHRRIFDKMVGLSERSEPDRFRHAARRAVARRRARRGRRPGLHRVAHRRRAALGQRRVLREDRQGEVDAPQADPVGQQDSRRGLRRRGGPGPAARRGRALDLPSPRTACAPASCRCAISWRAAFRDREAAAAQGARHRRADRFRRPRRDDVRVPAVGSRHRRGAAVDGQDELRAQHRAALRHSTGKTVGIFSLEMSKEQLFMRMLTSEARVDAHRFRGGFLSEQDYARLSQAFGTLPTPRSSSTTRRRSASSRCAPRRAGSRSSTASHLLVIDYLQLMQGRGRFENRQQELASISRSLKILAKELSVPIVALSQLSRAPETRAITGRSSRTCASRARSNRTPTSSCSSSARSSTATRTASANQEDAGHGRDHHRQAAQRPDRHRQAGVPQGVHALREPGARHRHDPPDRRPRRSRRDPRQLPRHRRAISRSADRPAPRIIAVVKANAYGHGAPHVALALEEAGASMLACADIEEGVGPAPGRRAGADPRVRRAQRQRSRRRLRARPDADGLDAGRRARACRRRPRAATSGCAVTSRSTPA